MTTLLDALYLYAQDKRIGPLLSAQGDEYRQLLRRIARDRTELEGLLEGRAAELLARCTDHRGELEQLEGMALFRCGLSLGLELGCMAHGT